MNESDELLSRANERRSQCVCCPGAAVHHGNSAKPLTDNYPTVCASLKLSAARCDQTEHGEQLQRDPAHLKGQSHICLSFILNN